MLELVIRQVVLSEQPRPLVHSTTDLLMRRQLDVIDLSDVRVSAELQLYIYPLIHLYI